MINFYIEWSQMRANGLDDSKMIEAFLKSESKTIEPLLNKNTESFDDVFNILNKAPIEKFFEVIENFDLTNDLAPSDVPCFSNFENGANRLCELLEFHPNGITYSEAGYELMNSIKKGARTKYGENHAKLAAIMSLVTISNSRPAIVNNTPWGSYLTNYSFDKKQPILKKLLLRDRCLQLIINYSMKGNIKYKELVANLSRSTAIRRRSNVKCLVEKVVFDSNRTNILDNIDWDI